jgi:hypothetical protein
MMRKDKIGILKVISGCKSLYVWKHCDCKCPKKRIIPHVLKYPKQQNVGFFDFFRQGPALSPLKPSHLPYVCPFLPCSNHSCITALVTYIATFSHTYSPSCIVLLVGIPITVAVKLITRIGHHSGTANQRERYNKTEQQQL